VTSDPNFGSIYTVSRTAVASTPRTLNFYGDALVIAFASRNIHLKRFGVGAASGKKDYWKAQHSVDQKKLSAGLGDITTQTREGLFALARESTRDELVAANDRNELIPYADIETVELNLKVPWLTITLVLRDGRMIKQYCNTKVMTLDSVMNLLHRFWDDKVVLSPPAWAENIKKLRANGTLK
jgi:hypothetical protein